MQRGVQSEVFSRASLHTACQLRTFLGFQDQLQPSLDTLNDVFLVQFISCIVRGLHNCIVTSKMTKR